MFSNGDLLFRAHIAENYGFMLRSVCNELNVV